MQVEFKGILSEIGKVETFPTFTVVRINVTKPAWTDDFGEKKGKDEIFPMQAFKEKIEQVNTLKAGDKVHVKAYLNAKESVGQNGVNRFLQLTVNDIKKL